MERLWNLTPSFVGSTPTSPVVLLYAKIDEREVLWVDYCIKNNKNVYIKLNENGCPVTCVEAVKGIFESSKAKNILSSLPKSLKRFNFQIEAIPNIVTKSKEETVIEKEEYILSDEVNRWFEKFGACDEIITEAKDRREELLTLLSNVDKELSNELHKIELEKSKNAYQGFLEYKQLKSIMERRRNIKDELMIISNVLRMDFRHFNAESVDKAIKGLATRKFTMRVLEGDEDELLQGL